jgi:hypothetical protein
MKIRDIRIDNTLEDNSDNHTKHFATKINDKSVNIDNENNIDNLNKLNEEIIVKDEKYK